MASFIAPLSDEWEATHLRGPELQTEFSTRAWKRWSGGRSKRRVPEEKKPD